MPQSSCRYSLIEWWLSVAVYTIVIYISGDIEIDSYSFTHHTWSLRATMVILIYKLLRLWGSIWGLKFIITWAIVPFLLLRGLITLSPGLGIPVTAPATRWLVTLAPWLWRGPITFCRQSWVNWERLSPGGFWSLWRHCCRGRERLFRVVVAPVGPRSHVLMTLAVLWACTLHPNSNIYYILWKKIA